MTLSDRVYCWSREQFLPTVIMQSLVVGNTSYALWSDAIGRHTALADLHLPATVKTIHFVVEEGGHRSATVVVPRPSASFTDNPTNQN